MSDEEKTKAPEKPVFVPKSAAELQKLKLEKLMKNPSKPAYIPDRPEEKLPRAFNPPEFVRNIWGSSAGAGSGDFHVYRCVRRREYAREKYRNIKAEKDELDEQCLKRLEEYKTKEEERTAKKRQKRLKKKKNRHQKQKKQKTSDKKQEQQSESSNSEGDEDDGVTAADDVLPPNETRNNEVADGDSNSS